MSLKSLIQQQLEERGILLMTHIVCGYPSLEDNWTVLKAMSDAGVSMVEFQFPFSEPSADGPLFCRANQSALEAGTRISDCLDLMRRASAELTFAPLMMGYYNTAFHLGHADFCARLADAGARGFILPDLPPEEAGELEREAARHELEPIYLMTPTTTDARLKLIAAHAQGFIYCVARRGVTGAQTDFDADLAVFLARCREATDLPLAVGFGVGKPEDVTFLKGRADVAIVGTAMLRAFEEGGETAVRDLVGALANAAL